MRKAIARLVLAMFLLFSISQSASLSEDDGMILKEEVIVEEPDTAALVEAYGLSERMKNAKTFRDALDACNGAIERCASYEDYEKLSDEIDRIKTRREGREYSDIINYACAKTRFEELSYLTKKNDIDSGRIYMSVNEKYNNSALDCLDVAALATKSKDLEADIYFLRFLIFKEMFQPEKADAIFNEMVSNISSYSEDKARNIAKLNEISKKFIDNGLGEYAMKLKLAYSSKADPQSAKMIVDEIRSDADIYFEAGKTKESLTTYDTYLQMAESHYDKETVAAKLMEIAEKYFNKGQYKEAIRYYSLYLFKYSASQSADYAGYKLAISYHNSRDYPNAITKLEEFLKAYPNSVWFEKGFEGLCKLYYETSGAIEKALEALQKLIDAYPRRDTRDYANLLIGILYYNKADYDKALEVFKKTGQEFPRSVYLYAAETLTADIKEIKKGASPSFSFGSNDVYKIWEPYMPMNADISAADGASAVENKDGRDLSEIYVKTKGASRVTFTMAGLEDLDRFSEYWQDKEDQSRLPREVKTGAENDLVFFAWSSPNAGKFLDDKQTLSKIWQAPNEPGDYVINVNIGDLGLVRPPDSGSKKDNPKTLTIHVAVE